MELLLLYQLVFSVGVTSFLAFIGLTFLGDKVVEYTQWPACPFMQELANVNLAYGFLGILCIWFRHHFWTAVVIGFSIWILGDAIHHFYDAKVNLINSDGNTGLLVYTDIVIPIILLVLLAIYLHYQKEEKDEGSRNEDEELRLKNEEVKQDLESR